MNRFLQILILLGVGSQVALGTTIAIGDLYLTASQNGTQQFYLDNFTTGASGGCSAPSGFPVCTQLFIAGTLNYSYFLGGVPLTGSTALAFPLGADIGGTSWAPSNFIFPASYVFSSAIFSGTLSLKTFALDTNPGTLLFNSDGTATSTDVIRDSGVIFTSGVTTNAPETSSLAFVTVGAALLCILRKTSPQIGRTKENFRL